VEVVGRSGVGCREGLVGLEVEVEVGLAGLRWRCRVQLSDRYRGVVAQK
jgi:hypothetical protein